MVSATALQARELELSIGQRIGGDSNVLRTDGREIEDGFYEFAPTLVAREGRHEDLSYVIRYAPRYRAFFETDGIDGVDHFQSARFDWQANPRDRFTLEQTFASTRTRRIESGFSDATIEASDRDRTQRASVNAGYSHAFTPRWFGNLGLDFQDLDFDRSGIVDNRAYGASLGTTYGIFESTTVGLSASGRFREARGLDSQNELSSENWSGSVAASISHSFSPTFDVSLQIGPSIIRSEPDSDSIDSTTDVSFFASANLQKRWREASFSVSYTRSESGGSGAVTSQVLDAVDVTFRYDPRPDWHFDLIGRWTQRQTLSDINLTGFTVGNQNDSQIFQALARASHRLTKRISVRADFSYQNQQTDQDASFLGSGSRTVETFSGFVSLEYKFDPWIF
jgi:hypothetical protein